MVLYSYGVMMKEMTTALDLSITQIITTSCESTNYLSSNYQIEYQYLFV